ncbi:MAG: GNAT family N-acetyltransferase [FCB group bacterium]|nr:GNAT family N-acetyltransferase [FCB group bacterium]
MKDLHLQNIISSEELEIAFSIRHRVFVEEQGVPESLERDQWEATSTHILVRWEKTAVGTARYRKTGAGFKLERFAVLPEFRHLGIGKALVGYILNQLPNSASVYLNAQEKVVEFYRKLGFRPVGKRFIEAGIVHQKMIFSPR